MILPRSKRKPHVGLCSKCDKPTRIKGANYIKLGDGESERRVLYCPRCAAPILLERIEYQRQEVLRKLA